MHPYYKVPRSRRPSGIPGIPGRPTSYWTPSSERSVRFADVDGHLQSHHYRRPHRHVPSQGVSPANPWAQHWEPNPDEMHRRRAQHSHEVPPLPQSAPEDNWVTPRRWEDVRLECQAAQKSPLDDYNLRRLVERAFHAARQSRAERVHPPPSSRKPPPKRLGHQSPYSQSSQAYGPLPIPPQWWSSSHSTQAYYVLPNPMTWVPVYASPWPPPPPPPPPPRPQNTNPEAYSGPASASPLLNMSLDDWPPAQPPSIPLFYPLLHPSLTETPAINWDMVKFPKDLLRVSQRGVVVPVSEEELSKVASHPPSKVIRIGLADSPWLEVSISKPKDITMKDVLEAVWDHFRAPMTMAEFHLMDPEKQNRVKEQYYRRCEMGYFGTPEYERRSGVRRIDWFEGSTGFGGLEHCMRTPTGEIHGTLRPRLVLPLNLGPPFFA